MDTAVLRRRGSIHSPEIHLERLPPSRAHGGACAADGSASVTFCVQALMLVLHLFDAHLSYTDATMAGHRSLISLITCLLDSQISWEGFIPVLGMLC